MGMNVKSDQTVTNQSKRKFFLQSDIFPLGMNSKSNQTMTNATDSGSTIHRKRRHMYTWHSEWCGEYDLEDRPIYLPRLTEQQIREVAELAGIQFRDSTGLAIFCPNCDLNASDGSNNCRLIERFGIPRLTCWNGCVCEINAKMRKTVLADLLFRQANRLDELEEETLDDAP
jgi:hypothetical protein